MAGWYDNVNQPIALTSQFCDQRMAYLCGDQRLEFHRD